MKNFRITTFHAFSTECFSSCLFLTWSRVHLRSSRLLAYSFHIEIYSSHATTRAYSDLYVLQNETTIINDRIFK